MKIISKNKSLIIIIWVALILRFYNLATLPASLNPDEAALGYNAFSILHTFKDEHGILFPTALRSFGDWKLPVYSYFSTIPVFILGLTELAVRLPSMCAGVLSVLIIYKIAKILFQKKEIALLAAFFLSISPWSIYFSRAAYEVNLGLLFFLLGLYFLLLLLFNKIKGRFVTLTVLSSALLFALALFTYHSFLLFIPLFVLSLFIIYRKKIANNSWVIFFWKVLFLLILASVLNNYFNGNNKISTLLIFNNKDIIYNRIEILRGDNAEKNIYIEKVLHTKFLGGIYHIGQNYLNSFSPSFLFDKGGEKLVHNIGSFGYLYLMDAFLLASGVFFLIRNNDFSFKLIAIWLMLAPIASSLTKDTPNATRLFILMPVFILISAYGAYNLIVYLKGPILRLVLLTAVMLYILNFIFFLDLYFIHFNFQRARFWRYGYKQAVLLANKYQNYKVVVRGPENFPYIYFLFYNKTNPDKFRKEVKYYKPTAEGFLYVKSFDRFNFVDKIDYSNLDKDTLYIDDNINISKIENRIYLPSGEAILQYQFVKD